MTAKLRLSKAEMARVEKALCESSFYEFVKRAWSVIDPADYTDNWHIKVICDHLQAVADGTSQKNLLINIAPGCAKSIIVNTLFSAWLWTFRPSAKILSLSHKEDLAIDNGLKARRLIESDWYQSHWPIKLRNDQNSKSSFANEQMGLRESSPATTVTGKRGNFVIFDDPHSVSDANSEAHRRSTVKNFREAITSRLNDPKNDRIIVVMQRLHVEDVSGFILEHLGDYYDHLCIPYVSTGKKLPKTSIGWQDRRKKGVPMFAKHFGPAYVEIQKRNLGPYAFSGQYQQNPVPEGDGFFEAEWFNRFDPEDIKGKELYYYMTSDHAPSGRGDYNVIRIWGIDAWKNMYLMDSFRKKCTMDRAFGLERGEDGKAKLAKEGALALIKKWQPLCWFPENDLTWSANSSLLQTFMRELNVFCAIKPMATKGMGDKLGKAMPFQAMASAGLVWLPKDKMGDEALEEYIQFGPSCRHDDQVDADGAIARMLNNTVGSILIPERVKPAPVDPWDRGSSYSSSSDLCWG